MKIEFYKAKHIWKNGQNATWTKSDKFDLNIFEKLKDEYEELTAKQKRVITFDGKTLFLFYRSGTDFSKRPIVEITAFLSNKSFNKNEKIHQELATQIKEIFEDRLDYTIKIDNSYVNTPPKKSIGKILGVMMSLVFMSIITFIFMRVSPIENISKKNDEIKVNDVNTSKNNLSKKSTSKMHKEKSDFKEFSKEWNQKITSLKNKYKINLDKYHIDEKKDILNQVNSFLNYKKGEQKLEEKVFKQIKDYKTLRNWMEKRKKKFKKNSITKVFTTNELRKAITEKMNFRKPFSNKTIEIIISWNEFTLFFERNKTEDDKKYGFKSCQDVKSRVFENYKFIIRCQ